MSSLTYEKNFSLIDYIPSKSKKRTYSPYLADLNLIMKKIDNVNRGFPYSADKNS